MIHTLLDYNKQYEAFTMLYYTNLENQTVLHLRKLLVNVYHKRHPDSLGFVFFSGFFMRTSIYIYILKPKV